LSFRLIYQVYVKQDLEEKENEFWQEPLVGVPRNGTYDSHMCNLLAGLKLYNGVGCSFDVYLFKGCPVEVYILLPKCTGILQISFFLSTDSLRKLCVNCCVSVLLLYSHFKAAALLLPLPLFYLTLLCACVHIHTQAEATASYTGTHTRTHTYTHVHTHTYTHTHTHTRTHTQAEATASYTRTHTPTHTYTQTYTHVHTHTGRGHSLGTSRHGSLFAAAALGPTVKAGGAQLAANACYTLIALQVQSEFIR